MQHQSSRPSCFTPFKQYVGWIDLPEKFTFPFYYEPHELSVIAAKELQDKLRLMQLQHNFGLPGDPDGMIIGKMFGVLVVQTEDGELGYLSAFSGKLANENHHEGFVPPVYDMLVEGDFFLEGIKELNVLNDRVEQLENSPEYIHAKGNAEHIEAEAKQVIEAFREEMRQRKKIRKQRREEAKGVLSDLEYQTLELELVQESLEYKRQLELLKSQWNMLVEKAKIEFQTQQDIIHVLKEQRKLQSSLLQEQLFSEYRFLNANGAERSLRSIFKNTVQKVPPSGAGECAAPKLLQYAYLHGLKPIAMAEFWWGASPKSEIRKHQQFYPSCRGKCEPILGHMLEGLSVDDNPMLQSPELEGDLEVIYEDDVMLAINKPPEFLSVPGKTSLDSVFDRMKAKYPEATGPLIIHRLDMATSGILLIAKTKEANKKLQEQFISKTIKKRYMALLDGIVEADSGLIDLPLRLDIDDRPRQLVCYEHGKEARTHWKVLERKDGKTLVHFFPVTGRTHQLRVHAAHPEGLNIPIVGDDLYGTRSSRLHLHAEFIEFKHPVTGKVITLKVDPDF